MLSHCPDSNNPYIPLSKVWIPTEYSTIQSHMRTHISQCSFNLGTKHMFYRSLSLIVPTWIIKLSSTLYLDESEDCHLTSQISESLPYHSQVAKRCQVIPELLYFSLQRDHFDLGLVTIVCLKIGGTTGLC